MIMFDIREPLERNLVLSYICLILLIVLFGDGHISSIKEFYIASSLVIVGAISIFSNAIRGDRQPLFFIGIIIWIPVFSLFLIWSLRHAQLYTM